MPVRRRLETAYLYLVTPGGPSGPPGDFLARVLAAGVDVVQLRDKDLPARQLLAVADVFRSRTAEFGALFIVNDRVDLAQACGADGVHLGQDDLPVAQARRLLGPEPLIGLSTHSEEQVRAGAAAPEVDYLGVGPVYTTPTKPGRAAVGLPLVSFAAAALGGPSGKPWFAIGGIGVPEVDAVAGAGARRVAVVRAITGAADPAAAARALRAALGVPGA